MDQGVPGSQNEPFFELLHPSLPLAPSPLPNSLPPVAHNDPTMVDSPPRKENFDFGGHDVLPSFDFQPIRSGSSTKVADSGGRVEESSSFGTKGLHPSASDGFHEPKIYPSSEPTRVYEPAGKSKQDMELYDSVTVAAVERTMKKYADNLLCVLEGMSGRLLQLETTAQGLEHSIEGLKVAEGENHGQTNGRLGRLENLIKEVQAGVQLLRDKQEVAETKSQLMKLQLLNDNASLTRGVTHTPAPDGLQQPKGEVTPQHLMSPPPPPSHQLPHHPQTPPSQPQAPPSPQQLLSSSISTNIPNEPGHPPMQQQPPPPPPPSQQHPAAPPHLQQPPPHSMQLQSFYSPQSQPHQSSYNQQVEASPYGSVPVHPHHPAPAAPSSSSYAPELPPYIPGSYEGPRPLTAPQQPLPPPPQQHGPGGPQQLYEPVVVRIGSSPGSLPPSYLPQPQPVPPASMYETQTGGYGTQPYRVAQPVPSAPSGGSGYPRLPTAQSLQHALPTSSSGSSGGNPLSTNRVPIDEVIEKVGAMGFSRDQVKAVVRRLTENGQSVDLNVVLDKLMNGGGEVQPQKGWFGRSL